MKRLARNPRTYTAWMVMCFMLVTTIVLTGTGRRARAHPFAAGSGTLGDPYIITTAEQLNEARNYLASHFRLEADIDLTAYGAAYDSGQGWAPIGDMSTPFAGSIDGNGHVIHNLYVNRPATNQVGLIGVASSGSQIRDLGLVAVDVTGQSETGGLVGYGYGSVSRCFAAGTVQGMSSVGGLVGRLVGAVSDSYAKVSTVADSFGGGLVGYSNSADINHSFAAGAVTATSSPGGLAGGADASSNITDCYYDSEVSGCSDAGRGEPRTTAEMKTRCTYGDWDFLGVWAVDEGNDYPVLRWEAGAPQSGFAVTGPAGPVEAEAGFQLTITGAKGEDGAVFDGASMQVTVYSDLQGANVVQSAIDFSGGGATVPVILTAVGTHNLRIWVDGVSYSNVVTVEVTEPQGGTAPVLHVDGYDPALAAIYENDLASSGNTVGEIVPDGSITYAGGSTGENIAVTSVDNTNGKWQYSINGGAAWLDVSGVTGSQVDLSANSLLLDENARIRFVPDADWHGTSTFTYRAWRNDGAGLQLDGVDDCVAVSGLGTYSAITFETWIRMDSFSDGFNVILNGDNWEIPGLLHTQFLKGNPTQLEIAIYNSPTPYVRFDYDFNAIIGKWTHIAVTINKATGNFKLYVDGVYRETKYRNLSGIPGLNVSSFNLGAWNNGGTMTRFSKGIFSDFRLWSAERSEQEIADNMANGSLTGNESGLVGNWKFNEGTGTVVADSGPGGHDGTIQGGAAWVSSSGQTANTTVNGGSTPFSAAVETASLTVNPLSVISINEIQGVTPPANGATPVAAIAETAEYTGAVTWNPNDNPFKWGTVYTATITLTPRPGYTLTGVPANFFAVSGATTVSNAADSGVVTAVFPATDYSVIDPERSSVERITQSPVVAGIGNIILRLTIMDDQGAPISGEHWVNVSRSVPGDWVHTTYVFDSNGQASVTLTATAAGTYEGVRTEVSPDNNNWVEIGRFDVTVAPGAPTAVSVVAAPATLYGGGGETSVITARVTDSYGNGVPGATINFAVTGGSGTLSAQSGATDGTGRASTNYTTSVGDGGDITVSAAVEGTAVAGSATIRVVGPDISGDFTDDDFKQAVWEWLGNPAGSTPGGFTQEDLYDRVQVTPGKSLDVSNRGIESLDGFEHFQGSGLLSLYCPGNQLVALPELPATLQTLWVRNNRITHLPALPDSLQHLDCSDNRLTDLPSLPQNLSSLACQNNYLNVFSGSLKTAIDACGATTKTVTPQYRYTYVGEAVTLDEGQHAAVAAGDIGRQVSADGEGIAWTAVDFANLADFTFSSSDADVAVVSPAGEITATGAGSCTVYADYLGVNSDFTRVMIAVTVIEAEPVPAPTLVGAETSIDGSVITLAFSKAMGDPAGKHGQFSARVDGVTRGFSSAALRGGDATKVDLMLDNPAIKYGQVVTVSYSPGTVTAADGGVLGSFTDQHVVNNALFAGGKGTVENPYLIETPEHLDNVRLCLDASYRLENDMDLSYYLSEQGAGYNGGAGWTPIGTYRYGSYFTGHFDGNHKSIVGLSIDLPGSDDPVGLFGCAYTGAVIKDLHLDGVDVIGQEDVGALVGLNYGSITGCSATGSVSGDTCVGGLAGSSRGSISCSYFAGSVTGAPGGYGGIGGLVGYSFADGVGSGDITDSYAVASVTGPYEIGGLVGYNEGAIARSYAAGEVKGDGDAGGLVGVHDDGYGCSIADCYYDRETTGQGAGVGAGDGSGVMGATTAEMKQQATFSQVGWQFSYTWAIVDGSTYPYLRWQTSDFDFAPPVFASGYPRVENTASSSTNLQAQVDEGGKVYYVVLVRDSDRPSAAEIKQGMGKGGATPVVAGTGVLVGGAPAMVTIGGLQPQTSYDIYVVAEDAAGNLQPDVCVALVQVTTQAGAEPAPAAASLTPPDGATAVALNATVSVLFDRNVTVNDLSGVTIVGATEGAVGNVVATLNADGRTMNIAHDAFAVNAELYTVTIPADSVRNSEGIGNAGITWSFTTAAAQVDTYAVTFAVVGGNGTLTATADGVTIASGAQVTEGAEVVFTAIPGPGYQVSKWEVNGVGQAETGTTMTMQGLSAPVDVTVEFVAPSLPALGGSVNIGGMAKYGEVLTADTSGLSHTPDTHEDRPTYQWKRDDVNIDGATGTTYTLTADDIGKRITVTVTADGVHATGSVTSEATAVVEKADGPAAPAAPELESKTHSSVTLRANSAHEFRVDGGAWQDSNVFTGLMPSTKYTFTARVRETRTHEASAEGPGLEVTTEAEPPAPGQVEAPTATPSGGTVDNGTIVTLATTTEGATIHYTTDGTDPDRSSSMGTTVTISGEAGSTVTVRAIAMKEGMVDSGISTFTYRIAPASVSLAVYSTSPSDGATGVSVGTDVVITFNMPVWESVYFSGISISGGGSVVSYAYGFDNSRLNLRLDPTGSLVYSTEYTVTVPAGAVEDGQGNRLEHGCKFSFITRSRPSRSREPEQLPKANVIGGESKTAMEVSLDVSEGKASVNLDEGTLHAAFEGGRPGGDGVKTAVVEMPKVQGANSYVMQLPTAVLASDDANRRLEMVSEVGKIALPGNMLEGMGLEGSSSVGISMGEADKSGLPREVQDAIGDRPLVSLSMTVDGRQRSWSNPDAPVTVSIPYTPTAAELADPEHITVWYIDGAGNVVSVPSGRYDPVTGMVTFTVTHFSEYAVVYVQKTFGDLADVAWAKDQVEVLASKGILRGVTETEYRPAAAITRADYLYFLVRTLGVSARFEGNFDDIPGDAYYFEEIGVARRLGITNGVGENRFEPAAGITRQDMMALTERALRMLGRLEQQGSAADVERFSDYTSVAPYAVESVASLVKEGLIQGDGERLNPLGGTTRAEAAVFLYRIYNSRR